MKLNQTILGVILGLGLALGLGTAAMAESVSEGPFKVRSVYCVNESANIQVCGMEIDRAIIPTSAERCESNFTYWESNNVNQVLTDLAIEANQEQKDVFVFHDGCIPNERGRLHPKVVGIQMQR